MSDAPLDLKTTGLIGVVVAAVIGALRYFANWRTPEDARFDRGVRDELRAEIKRAQERYDELLTKHDELLDRFERLHRELLDEKTACSERLSLMEKRMQALGDAREACDREGCPSRMSPSGEFRVALRQIEED